MQLVERDPTSSPFSNAAALKSKNIKGKGGRKVAGAVARQSGSAAGRLDLLHVRLSPIWASHLLSAEQAVEPETTAERRADHVRFLYVFLPPLTTPHLNLTLNAPLQLSSISLQPTLLPPQAAQARASAILASQSARKEQRQRAVRGNKVEA